MKKKWLIKLLCLALAMALFLTACASQTESNPGASPTPLLSLKPEAAATITPTEKPTVRPTAKPTAKPTVKPTTKPTVKPTAQPTSKPEISGIYYWTPGGKSHHATEDCSTLKRSKVILSGTLDEAFSAGKDDPCDVCMK